MLHIILALWLASLGTKNIIKSFDLKGLNYTQIFIFLVELYVFAFLLQKLFQL